MSSQNRVAVISGGSTGIGRAIAETFARHNTHVVIIGRRQDTLQATTEEIGTNCSWQQADVSQRHQVSDAVAAIIEKHGKIDVLVNNAGFVLGETTDMPPDEAEQAWDHEIGTNLKGAFLMSITTAPHLPRHGGRIINISSIAAFTGGSRPGAIGYAAAKAGLLGMTYALARELSPQGITVNAVAPGFIANTEFTGAWSEERIQSIVAQTPVGRAGDANDVAEAVLFLASPEASFITGEVLNVNGGWLFGR
jgi:3-oxoacyl-[acyl-carrier protein] reductase